MTDREYLIKNRLLSFYFLIRLLNRLAISNVDDGLNTISLHDMARDADKAWPNTPKDHRLYKYIERLIYKEIK